MHKKIHPPLSHHYEAEASGCDSEIINDVDKVQQILIKAAEKANATICAISFERFPPSGVNGVVMISESYINPYLAKIRLCGIGLFHEWRFSKAKKRA